MTYNLCPLLPSIKPCEPMDTIYTRYLNQTHAPLIKTLNKALHIELYNGKWFDKPFKTSVSLFTYKHDTLKLSDKSVSPFTSVVDLHDEISTLPPHPLCENVDDNILPTLSPLTLHKSVENIDCLFFIQYTPEDTIKPRQYLIQVNHIETKISNMDSLRTSNYHVTFCLAIPMISIFVVVKSVGGLSCMNIIWMTRMSLFMVPYTF